MKIKPYVEKLEQSGEYKEFRTKHPNAFMMAGFFVLDFESGNNIHQIDFFVPKEKKIAAFTLDKGVNLQLLDALNSKKAPEKLDLDTKIDLDALQGILLDEMHNRDLSETIKKIIAVVQSVNGKRIWNLNCVLSGMEILKSHVEDESMTVLKIEKQSLLDIIQQIPAQQLMKAPVEKKDFDEKLKNLDKITAEIEKEKTRLQQEMKKKSKKSKGRHVANK